ncbi:hypothetical protein PNA2_1886 [Pyrococcus sp. NA2]|uniref:metallophosphoesterase n=1 Tax=Pyrococcus sp. (strain NA2) TaxID=342949 RepID=UPI000209ACF2|nr:metallophosphoesterase [Pyrococcus sp. NA2]AEC52800.1 hypothetical protein PNA2_1886 [Pyrococcus sp. NA2]
MRVKLLPSKAVMLGKTLVIADIHIGFEEVALKEGVYIPKLLTEVIDTVKSEISRMNAERLVINGDLKHSFTPLKREFFEVGTFLKEISEVVSEIVLVKGNHDTGIEWIRRYGVEIVDSLEIGKWTITHGHRLVEGENFIIGHEHPSIRLRDEVGAVIKVPVFLKGENVIVLPAFSPWAYGNDLTINNPISPILQGKDIWGMEVVVSTGEEVLNFGKLGLLIEVMKRL